MKTVIEIAHTVYGANTKWNDSQLERLNQLVELACAGEREACASECDEWIQNGSTLAEDIAAAIRARGTHET